MKTKTEIKKAIIAKKNWSVYFEERYEITGCERNKKAIENLKIEIAELEAKLKRI